VNVLYVFTARECDACTEAKPIVEEFKRKNLFKVMVVIVDATHRVIALADIDPQATPTFALVDDRHEVLKKHVGVLSLDQLQDFVFGNFGVKRKKEKV